VPLPVAGEVHGLVTLQGQLRNPVHLLVIRDAAVVLTPRGLLRVLEEICPGDVVVNSDLGSAQAGEDFLSHVNARAIEAVCLLMINSLDLETLMQVKGYCLDGESATEIFR
jgi:hypothetical protein